MAKKEQKKDNFADLLRNEVINYLERHSISLNAFCKQADVGYPSLYSFVKRKPLADNRSSITLMTAEKVASALGKRIILD